MSEIKENNVEKDDGAEEFMIPGHLNPSPEKFRDWAGLDNKWSSDPDSVEYNVYCIEQKFDSGKYPQLSVVQWDPWTCQGAGGARSSPFSISFGPSYSQDMVWSRSPTFVPEADSFKVEPTDDAIKPILLSTFKEQGLTEAFNAILPADLRGRLELSKMEDEIAYEVLYSKLLHHPTITKINVPTAQYCTAALVNLCCNLLINSDTLEEIFFRDIGSLDEQMVQKLFESVKISRNLKVLNLRTSRYLETWKKASPGSHSNKPSIRAEPVLAALKSLEGSSECPLETLDFGGNTIVASPSVGELMTTLLSSSLGLKRLSFRGCDLTEEVLLVVATELEGNDCLEYLDLSHNRISKEVMEHLVKNTTLKELKLEHGRIDLEIVECLASSLPQMQRLRHLYMDGNDFTWEPLTETKEAIGTITMLNALEKHESLLSLEMGEFGMLAPWCMSCCQSPPYNTTLSKDNIEKLRLYLERNRKGSTSLMKASSEGQTETVEELLSEEGVGINIADTDGDTALMYASRNGQTEIARLLSNKGADITAADKDGNTALTLAASQGHSETVKLLSEKGGDITVANKKGWTALMLSSANGHTEVVKLLSDLGVDVNIANKQGDTALMLAHQNRHTNIVKLLLDKGADITIANNRGETVLMWASQKGHTDIVKTLPEKGADINTGTSWGGNTALMSAAARGHTEIVGLLSEKGADITVANKKGLTALMLASDSGHNEIVKLLSDKGADFTVCTKKGRTALMLASARGHTAIVIILLDLGADINVANKGGNTPLMLAVKKGHAEIVKLLLERGADITISNAAGDTALIWASRKGHTESVKLLSDMGADINVVNEVGETALKLASDRGHSGTVKLLLEKGADIDNGDKNGVTPLMGASERGHADTVQFLVEMGADILATDKNGSTALSLAVAKGYPDVVEILLATMCDSDTPLDWVKILVYSNKSSDEFKSDDTSDNNESEYESSEEDSTDSADDSERAPPKKWKGGFSLSSVDIERVQSLLGHPKKEGFINWKNDFVGDGRTMLLSSIVHKRWDIVKLLLKHGADANIADKDGKTPLDRAVPMRGQCTNGHLETINSLINNGADPDIKDNEGMTSLHLACRKGSLEVVQLLIGLGVNGNTKTTQGFTPLHVASERNHLEIVWHLVRQCPTLVLEQLE